MLEVLVWQNANTGVKESKQSAQPELYIPEFMQKKSNEKEVEVYNTSEIRDILSQPRA